MKGIIFNLVEEIVTRELGDGTWDALLEAAKVDGAYTSLGNYPDEELAGIVTAAAQALGKTPAEIVAWTGRLALPLLAQRYPQFFERHESARSFILSLNHIIHPEVRKVYPGATPPDFEFDASSPERLLMTYRSHRKLCAFARGLMQGSADHYDEDIVIEETECMQRGHEACRFSIAVTKRVAVA